MTDLITAEDAKKLLDECDSDGCLTCEYARSVIALHAQLADAQAAQAMAVGRCAEEAVRTTAADGQRNIKDQWRAEIGEEVASAIRDLAPIDGLALVRELRAERDAASAVAATAYGASLDWEQILKDDALWQAQDDIAKSRVACMAAEADRDRLAAANAALEAKVAGLAEALKKADTALSDEGYRETQWPRPQIRAALATQEAGNAQSTPPISPEEAQFNAVRYHERFGPLDEKGNPVDPRRRG